MRVATAAVLELCSVSSARFAAPVSKFANIKVLNGRRFKAWRITEDGGATARHSTARKAANKVQLQARTKRQYARFPRRRDVGWTRVAQEKMHHKPMHESIRKASRTSQALVIRRCEPEAGRNTSARDSDAPARYKKTQATSPRSPSRFAATNELERSPDITHSVRPPPGTMRAN